jgi:hypothetical protein
MGPSTVRSQTIDQQTATGISIVTNIAQAILRAQAATCGAYEKLMVLLASTSSSTSHA